MMHRSLLGTLFYHHGVLCATYPYLILAVSLVAMVVLSWPCVASWEVGFGLEKVQLWEKPSRRFEDCVRAEQLVLSAPNTNLLDKHILGDTLNLMRQIETTQGAFSHFDKNNSLVTLSDLCFKPQNSPNCLIHSPLEFWQNNWDILSNDTNLLKTLSDSTKVTSFGTPIPLHSVFGGVVISNTEIVSADSIVLTYFLDERRIRDLAAASYTPDLSGDNNNSHFASIETTVSQLWDSIYASALTTLHPTWSSHRSPGDIRNVYYIFSEPEDLISIEFVILVVSYLIVFFYISLVLGRVELVKSKFGLGLGAVVMVFSSLIMSVGLTTWMGVTSELVPWEVLPFLIIAIGVENIFVMTNAVVTSSIDLPVKERVGIGLSKVGAKMTYSLASELCLLVLVSLIDVPALQEFCLFAAVAVVIDFMMQITFFTTILSIDIRRLELSDLHKIHAIKSRQQSAKSDSASGNARGDGDQARVKRWSAILIIVLMFAIGLGMYGTASAPAEDASTEITSQYQPTATPTTPNDRLSASSQTTNPMRATADLLWDLLNPPDSPSSEVYVQTHPPVLITMSESNAASLHSTSDSQSTPPPSESQPIHPNHATVSKEKWTITIDQHRFEIPRSVFIPVFVGLMILVCLGVVMVSAMAFYLFKSSKRKKHVSTAVTTPLIQNNEAEEGMQRVAELAGSNVCDVVALDSSDDGTVVWVYGDGWIHIWNRCTLRKVVVADGCVERGDGVSCLKVRDGVVVAGTFGGDVRVWEAYEGKLVSELKRGGAVCGVDVEAGGRVVVVRVDGAVDVWRIHEGMGVELSRRVTGVPVSIGIGGESVVVGSAGGVVTVMDLTREAKDIEIANVHGSNNTPTAVASSHTLDIIITGSETGEITLLQASTKKELLFIPSKPPTAADAPTSRQSFDSEASSSTSTSTSKITRMSTPRAGAQLAAHCGEITFLHILQPDTITDSTDVTRFLLVSAGVDSYVHIWDICMTKQGHISIRSVTKVRSVRQPGCVVATCFEDKVIGTRRRGKRRGDVDSGTSGGLRNRRGKSGGGVEEEGWWEVWVLDLSGVLWGDGGVRGEEKGVTVVRIGEDLLVGVELGGGGVGVVKRREDRLKRGQVVLEERVAESMSKKVEDVVIDDENEWTDSESIDVGSSSVASLQLLESPIGWDEGSISPLPVLGIHLVSASRWGVVCGFGNIVKVVFVDLGAAAGPREGGLRRVSSGVGRMNEGTYSFKKLV
ncbi:hypothetical protein HDU98_001544 [Podochytrium sp. JEL0797]|nr:hypothetical protein HDU98_001544 [Podochytrium sp. JEL0797]